MPRERRHRLREQQRALERRLFEALGGDLADQLDLSAVRPAELRSVLQDARAEIFALREQLADAREELDAVREINRGCYHPRHNAWAVWMDQPRRGARIRRPM